MVGWLVGYWHEIVMLDKFVVGGETWLWYEIDVIP